MGCKLKATCLDCHTSFVVYDGGAVFSHAVRCERCGETKFINLEELGDLHTRFVKGLPGAYSSFTRQSDAFVQEHVRVDPISQAEYFAGIEAAAGRCACGGEFTFTAPPRCPACRSTRVRIGDCVMFYD